MNNKIYDPFLLQESFEEYCNKKNEYLTSHEIIDYCDSPKNYHLRKIGVLPPKESSGFALGTALHTRVLEGEEVYEQRYEIGGPTHKDGKYYRSDSQKFAKYQDEHGGKLFITPDDDKLVRRMTESVYSNEMAVELLAGGMMERSVRTEIESVPVQSRLDCVSSYNDAIVDLKTTRSLDTFTADSYKHGHHLQMAFYKMVLESAVMRELKVNKQYGCFIIAVENCDAHRCGIWYYQSIFRPTEIVRDAIRRWKQSMITGEWSDKFDQLQTFTEFDFVTK